MKVFPSPKHLNAKKNNSFKYEGNSPFQVKMEIMTDFVFRSSSFKIQINSCPCKVETEKVFLPEDFSTECINSMQKMKTGIKILKDVKKVEPERNPADFLFLPEFLK